MNTDFCPFSTFAHFNLIIAFCKLAAKTTRKIWRTLDKVRVAFSNYANTSEFDVNLKLTQELVNT